MKPLCVLKCNNSSGRLLCRFVKLLRQTSSASGRHQLNKSSSGEFASSDELPDSENIHQPILGSAGNLEG